MSAIEPCSKQPSRGRGMKRERVAWNYVRGTNSTSNEDDQRFTTITTTLVATVVIPVPTKTTTTTTLTLDSAFCTSTSGIQLVPSSSQSTTSIQPPPSSGVLPSSSSGVLPASSQPIPSSSLPSTAEPHVTSRQFSSFIIAIVLAVVVILFLIVSCLAWYKQRRRPPVTSSVGDRPSLLPKFSFERENEGPLKTSGTFVDKFTRLDNTHSPGVRWVADNHDTTNQAPQAKASRRSMLLFAHDTTNHQKSQAKASRGSMLLFTQSFGPSLTKATVVSTLITDLSDELPVALGQRLNVLAEYDDGWTFCVNERGEQGMVPVECLHTEKRT